MDVVRYYGAKPDNPDPRDHSKTYSKEEIPSSPTVDLRKYVKCVYDQGDLGSCTANALCGAYALDLQKQSVGVSNISTPLACSCTTTLVNTRETPKQIRELQSVTLSRH